MRKSRRPYNIWTTSAENTRAQLRTETKERAGVNARASDPGPSGRPASQARCPPQEFAWTARAPDPCPGQHVPAGESLLPGVATSVWTVDPEACARDVCADPDPSGCECWRAGVHDSDA